MIVMAKSPRITDSEGKTAKSWNYDVNLRRKLRSMQERDDTAMNRLGYWGNI